MLENLRKDIDEIDEQIAALLIHRAAISKKIGIIKAKAGLPVFDAERELSVIQKIGHKTADDCEATALVNIYRAILEESRTLQTNILVGEKAAK